MKIADEQPSRTNLKQFLENDSNRRLIVSTLMQTLSSFGYKKSVQSLRRQTNIVYQKQHLETIQKAIKTYEYSKLPDLIKQLRLPQVRQNQILQQIQELQLFYLFKLGEINEVLNQIQTVKLSEEKMIKFCSMIALDSFESHQKDFIELQESIITKCKQNQTQKSQAKSILLSYLTKNSISNSSSNNDIPKVVSAQSLRTNQINLKVTFIRLNQRLDGVIVIGQSKDQLQLSQCTIKNQTIKPVCSKWTGSIGLIQSIKWRQNKEGSSSYIGICSFEHFIVYKDGFQDLVLALSAKNLEIGKFLCFDFDMNEEIIYVGGLFNKLMMLDFGGELISQIKPFKMVRQLLITPKRDLLAIQAVKKGGLFRYSLSAQKQTKLFQTNLPFMDLKLQNDKIIVTNNAFIYVLDYDTFQTTATIQSPQNKKCFQIQAFFCGAWIMVYNQKLKGILVNGSVIKQHKWQQNFDAVDIIGTKMITYSQSRIKLWQPSSSRSDISQHGSSRSSVSSQQNESSCFSDSSEVNAGSQAMDSQQNNSQQNNDNEQLMQIQPMIDSDDDSQSS